MQRTHPSSRACWQEGQALPDDVTAEYAAAAADAELRVHLGEPLGGRCRRDGDRDDGGHVPQVGDGREQRRAPHALLDEPRERVGAGLDHPVTDPLGARP